MVGKKLQRFLALLSFLGISLLLFYGFFSGVILNSRFLLYQYRTRFSVAEKLNIDGRQLEKITRGIVDFMKGTGEETYFPIVVKGQEISFLNAKEVAHLEEIAEIITHAKQGMLVILIASVVLITALALKGTARNIAIGVLEGFGLLVLGVTVVGLSALFNLSGWIDAFHHLFFTGDSWVLNPVTDRLIYLCPAELFSTALLMMGVFGAGYFIVVLGLCMLVLRKTK